MSGHRSVLDLSWPLADVDHARNPASALIALAVRPAQGATGSQTDSQLTAERAAALNVDRLVDGFVGHPHLRSAGKLAAQLGRDLFWTQLLLQFGLHELSQQQVGRQLRLLRADGHGVGSLLGQAGSVVPRQRPSQTAVGSEQALSSVSVAHVPTQFTEHRRGCPAQALSDEANRLTAFDTSKDVFTLRQCQISTAVRGSDVGRNHAASLTEPALPSRTVQADIGRRLLSQLASPDSQPELTLLVSPRRQAHSTPPHSEVLRRLLELKLPQARECRHSRDT